VKGNDHLDYGKIVHPCKSRRLVDKEKGIEGYFYRSFDTYRYYLLHTQSMLVSKQLCEIYTK